MRKVSVSGIIAATALAVGLSSAIGGILTQRASDEKVCHVRLETNAAIRGLVDDFTVKNPNVTPKQLADTRAITLARFPRHC